MFPNRDYENIEKFIKDLEEAGADGFFFSHIDEIVYHKIKQDIYFSYLSNVLNVKNYTPMDVKLAYRKLEESKRQEVFSGLIVYLKSTYLDFKREKIQLISKKQLKEVIGYWEKIGKIYKYDYADPRLLKSGKNNYFFENEVIKRILRTDCLQLRFLLDYTDRDRTRVEFLENYWVRHIEENETPYELVVRVIEEINQINKYFEFVWDKDEE